MSELRDVLTLTDAFGQIDFEVIEDTLCIDLDNPNAGDSDSGFGVTAFVTLTREQTLTLVAYLQKHFIAH